MPVEPNLNLIVVEDPSANLREAIQELVKLQAKVWWHEMPDVWIVQGDTPSVWRDRITPLKTASGESEKMVLVLRLPELVDGRPLDDRNWATHGSDSGDRSAWFHEKYTDTTPKTLTPPDDIPF